MTLTELTSYSLLPFHSIVFNSSLLQSTKALFMRGHPRSGELADKLIRSLTIYETAPTVAEK